MPTPLPSISSTFRSLLACLASVSASAQAPTLTVVQPARHAPAAPRTATVQATFSQAIGSGRATVFSSERGRLAGTSGVTGNVLTFSAAQGFRPGEKLRATVAAGQGSMAAVPQVTEFTAAVGGGTGVFSAGGTAALGADAKQVGLADMNGDGALDLLTVTPTDIVLGLNDGNGSFGPGPSLPVEQARNNVVAADVDGDGDLDLLAVPSPASAVYLWRNTGNGFAARTAVSIQGMNLPAGSMGVADVDGDHDLDVVVMSNYVGRMFVLFNDGAGNFTTSGPAGVGSLSSTMALADIDNDGDIDVLTSVGTQFAINVFLNNGSGSFSAGTQMPLGTGEEVDNLVVGDIDGDGDVDLVGTGRSMGKVLTWFNNGNGAFTAGQNYTVSGGGRTNLADVDADGDLDMLIIDLSGMLRLLRNAGNGTFGAAVVQGAVSEGLDTGLLTVGDVDNDGDLDVVVRSGTGAQSGTTVFFNNNTALATKAAAASQLALWPNPARTQITLRPPAGARQVLVYTALGQLVREVAVRPADQAVSIGLDGLPAGLYVVRTGAATARLLVE